jgi:methanogenic corrinoid protein MtbC1
MAASDHGIGALEFNQPEESVPFERSGGGHSSRRRDALWSTIEIEIIPRLMLAHRAEQHARRRTRFDGAPATAPRGSVDDLAELALGGDANAAIDYVRGLRDSGASVEKLLLELLAPAARRLGEWWTADLCTFTDVTIALGRLQYLLRDLGLAEQATAVHAPARRALITAVPGEQHTFGSCMVADFLRRDGWEVRSEVFPSERALGAAVRADAYQLLGVSLSVDRGIATIKNSIDAARCGTCNGTLAIIVGGRVFVDAPELVADVGADGTAGDARAATDTAAALVDERSNDKQGD